MEEMERMAKAIEQQAKATRQLAEAVAMMMAEMADPEEEAEHRIPQSLSARVDSE